MAHTPSDSFDDPAESPQWSEYLSWGTILTLAWLIYEVTARPSFGIVVACAKFGWNDFLTAHWLLRTDPQTHRGRTCFWFYIANGLWKVTVAAFLLTGSLLILMVVLRENAPKMLIGVGLTAIVGVSLLAVIPLIGVLHARWYGTRVWVDASVHESRRQNVWPPQASGLNATMGLLFPALMVPIIVTAIATFRFGIFALLASVFGEGLFIWALFQGVCAATPADCWGSDFLKDPEDDSVSLPAEETADESP
jgi:hypothetical protein